MEQAKKDLNEAIKDCDRDEIDSLIQDNRISIWTYHLYDAFQSGGFELCKFMMKYVSDYRVPRCQNELAVKLMNKDDYSILDEAIKLKLAKLTDHLFNVASGCDFNLLKHLLEFVKPCLGNHHRFSKDGMRKMCQCAWVTADSFTYAAKKGKDDVMLYLKEIGTPMDFSTIFAVIANDDLKMFKLMEEHFPDRVKNSYCSRYHWYGTYPSTFDCYKYFHSLGHMPTYDVYQYAVKYEPDNQKLLNWLKDIKCPGTFDVTDIPENFEYRIKYDLNPRDFPWLLKCLKDDEMKIDHETFTSFSHLAIVDILSEFVMYEPLWESECAINLFNFIGDTEPNSHTLGKVDESISKLSLERSMIMIDGLHLNYHAFASLYLNLDSEGYDLSDEEAKKIMTIIEEMKKSVKWNYVFLSDLNNWAYSEGSFYPGEMITKIDELWKKYENVIPELKDRTKWDELCENEPWKDDIREFIGDLLF